MHRFRDWLTGASAMLAFTVLIVATLPRYVPQYTPISSISRMLDSLAPWILVVYFLIVVFLFVLRALRHGIVFLLLGVLSGGNTYLDHHALSLPSVPDADPELRVLFFNVFNNNAAFADRIATRVLEMDPDVIAFAEGRGMYPAIRRLEQRYQRLTDCGFQDCQLLIYSKIAPRRAWTLNLNIFADGRYAVLELPSPTDRPRFVVFNHLVKAWMEGVTESELARLASQYDWLAGDVVALGDFNAAPWAHHIQGLLRKTGFRAQRKPVGTWPSALGALGVPIDQVLVHGRTRIVSAKPFGAGLGSNHRGLIVDLAYPAPES